MAKKLSKKNAKARRELKEELETAAWPTVYRDEDPLMREVEADSFTQKPYNFVYVNYVVEGKLLIGVGFSKYNPADEALGYPWDVKRGLQIALGRACADIARQVYP